MTTHRKKPSSARRKHVVKARFHVPGLSKAGSSLTLQIYADEQKLGTLEIGRGSLYWYPGRARKKYKRINWSDFADRMNELTYDH